MFRNVLTTILFFSSAAAINAAEYTVQMKNQGSDGQIMVFEPAVLKVAVGDTVHFEPVDIGHNSQSIPAMSPEGATGWLGMNSQKVSVTVDTEGVYVYKCQPHLTLAMIGVLVVGEPTNLDAIQAKVPAMEKALYSNKNRLSDYLAQID